MAWYGMLLVLTYPKKLVRSQAGVMWMQRIGGGSGSPIDGSDEASKIACMPCFCKAANGAKLAPVGEPREPRNPVSTSFPMVTMSGMTPADRYASTSALT